MPAWENVRKHDEPISVSSHVLARLGEELITNHIQALAELVKNAYDADATLVKVDIDTTRIVTDAGGTGRRGILTVADNGFGMDDQAIRRGWLRVSSSPKRAMKLAGIKTPKQRTPLGDKGLGRLGGQTPRRSGPYPHPAAGHPTGHDIAGVHRARRRVRVLVLLS